MKQPEGTFFSVYYDKTGEVISVLGPDGQPARQVPETELTSTTEVAGSLDFVSVKGTAAVNCIKLASGILY